MSNTQVFSKYAQKKLRTLAKERLGLSKNVSLKKIIQVLNEDTPTKFTEKNFYKKMNDFKEAEELQTRIKAEEEKQRLANIKRQETRRRNREAKKQEKEQKQQEELLNRGVWTYPISEGIGEFVSQLNKKGKNKSLVVDVIENKKRVKSIQINIEDKFWNWWESIGKFIFIYPVENAIFSLYPNATLYIYEGKEFDKKQLKKITQIFKDDDNGKCVFNPIRSWATNKYDEAVMNKNKSTKSRYNIVLEGLNQMEEKYPNGVNEENIDEICNRLQIDISIEKPLCDTKFITCKSIKKALKHFRYLNTRLNHVELNEYVIDNEPVKVSRDRLLELKEEFTKNNIYYTFTKDLTNINKIQTIDKVYALENVMIDTFNEFEIENGLIDCKIDDMDDKDLSQFIKHGTHYNGTIDFCDISTLDINDVFHIDMKKAYSQFKLCKFYEGFLGKITDFRRTDKIQSVGLYYITDLVIPEGCFKKKNDKLKIYKSHNIYASCELKFLESKGCSYKIYAGCWGVSSLDFEFNDEMLEGKNDDGNSYYALWTGKCDSHYLTKKTWINGDSNMCRIIAENTTGTITQFENNEICVSYDKAHNYHLGHITAFITAYQRLNMLEQLEAIYYDNIIRVCVDGIYTFKKVKDERLKNAFRHKNEREDKTFNNSEGISYISYLFFESPTEEPEEKFYYNIGNDRIHNNKELHIGAGGNGKTHRNLTDKGLIKILYVAPSWKLARNKEEEYGCKVSVWARLFIDNEKTKEITADPEMIGRIKKNSNVLLIDECSMMTEGQKNKIFELYDDMKIIFCGDLGYQLSAWNGDEMNNSGFDAIIENNTNYRCKDPILLKLLEKLREMIREQKHQYQINAYVNKVFESKNRIINNDKLKEMYKVDDMILVGTNKIKDTYTEMFGNIEKYYCKENNRLYSNGQIVIGNKPECKSELRHAYTTHSIQGETAYHNLYIENSQMFNARMFYTALSRAKTLSQIYIISN